MLFCASHQRTRALGTETHVNESYSLSSLCSRSLPPSLLPSPTQGAYFVSRQSNGTAVYHDILPSAGARFIDMAKFPQALGFELPKVPKKGAAGGSAGKGDGGGGGGEELSALKAARAASFARVIGLDFLLEDVVGRVHALDFDAFRTNDKLQPLHVVVSVRAWNEMHATYNIEALLLYIFYFCSPGFFLAHASCSNPAGFQATNTSRLLLAGPAPCLESRSAPSSWQHRPPPPPPPTRSPLKHK